jgi:TetR/AcrR family transcriptional regulator, mexJK operon transcriptional repressor
MPRVAGQVDEAKSQAILDAAAEILAQRGLTAPIEAIARRAGVSKQTVYNRYGSKTELARAMAARKCDVITAPLRAADAPGRPEEVLAQYGFSLLSNMAEKAHFKAIIQSAPDMPDLVRSIFEDGPMKSRAKLAAYLEGETAAGRLAVDDALQAAEFFCGMVIGHRHLRLMFDLEVERRPEVLMQTARAAARRFMRAYAPD